MGVLAFGNLILDPVKQEVTVRGQTHHLTPKECELLTVFIGNPGRVLTREFLMREVWDTEFTEDTRTLDVHIHWLRGKIEKTPGNPELIQTVRGVGYRFSKGEE